MTTLTAQSLNVPSSDPQKKEDEPKIKVKTEDGIEVAGRAKPVKVPKARG